MSLRRTQDAGLLPACCSLSHNAPKHRQLRLKAGTETAPVDCSPSPCPVPASRAPRVSQVPPPHCHLVTCRVLAFPLLALPLFSVPSQSHPVTPSCSSPATNHPLSPCSVSPSGNLRVLYPPPVPLGACVRAVCGQASLPPPCDTKSRGQGQPDATWRMPPSGIRVLTLLLVFAACCSW